MSTHTPILLVIDLQQLVVDASEFWGPRSTPNLLTTVPKILSAFRANNLPIIHCHHNSPDPQSPLHSSKTAAVAPHPCAAPLPGEPVIAKQTCSAFINTNLNEVLDNLGGIDGAECVNSAARNAADLGWKVEVVPEACASYGLGNRRGEGGETIAPEVVHKVMMASLGAYAKLVGVEELLGGLDGEGEKL
ncbi:hypothetical protein ACMFMG_002565 [Clarireedia jacksonii]